MASHLLIDLASAFLISYAIKENADTKTFLIASLIGYNAIAFLLQPFIGFWIDCKKNAKKMAAIGLLTGALSVFFITIPVILVCVIGAANAIYHVSGGSIVLRLDKNKSLYAGLFVSTGTLGIYLGYLASSFSVYFFIPVFILLLAGALLIKKSELTPYSPAKMVRGKRFYMTLIFLMAVVFLRGLVGGYLIFEWKQGFLLTLLVTMAVFLGKAAGGGTGDKLGLIKTGVIALFVSAPLLVCFKESVILSLVGLVLFNFSMPVTLFLLSRRLNGYEGFAFGITAFLLLSGSLISYSGIKLSDASIFALIGLSGLLLYMYDLIQRREEKK
ncbi:MAG: hypothetical protein JXQ23_12090 [Clostridia bacterium]|nr:hypothetical protein [Clostridia bacterium]